MDFQSKIYIAGHNGLVGSAIYKQLRLKGFNNIVIKSHSELDLINQKSVAEFFEKEKPEYVFLAAAKVGGIIANNKFRADFIYENLMIQSNVIHLSYLHKVKKLLFLGSTCIYPKESPQPMKEECLMTSELEYTNEPYAVAKIAGIKMCESYNLQYDTNFLSVMPTNLYGPNDNFHLENSHVLPALIRKLHLAKCLQEEDWNAIRLDFKKNPIKSYTDESTNSEISILLSAYGIKRNTVEIWGTGNPRREFLWSEDMADACIFLMQNVNFKDSFEKKKEEIRNTHINIGTGEDISIKELAQKVSKVVGFNGSLVFNTSKPDGTMKKLTDVSKLRNLGWRYRVSLNEGIERMYATYAE